jgi:hypothetical protein
MNHDNAIEDGPVFTAVTPWLEAVAAPRFRTTLRDVHSTSSTWSVQLAYPTPRTDGSGHTVVPPDELVSADLTDFAHTSKPPPVRYGFR